MTLTIYNLWIMTMSCSQVLRWCWSLLSPCSYSADLFRVMTQDCIHGSAPEASECVAFN